MYNIDMKSVKSSFSLIKYLDSISKLDLSKLTDFLRLILEIKNEFDFDNAYVLITYKTPKNLIEYFNLNLKCQIIDMNDIDKINNPSLIVDMMFLTKLKVSLINKITSFKVDVISIGLHSGLNYRNGVRSRSFQNKLTVNFFNYYLGQYYNDSMNYLSKEIVISPIKSQIDLLSDENFKNILPKRKRNTNKASYNRVTIFGGSKKYLGASYLSYLSLTSLICGAGYVNIVVPNSLINSYLLKQPQATLFPFEDISGNYVFNQSQIDEVISSSKVILFGMGINVNLETYKILSYIITNFLGKLVIDASGLETLSRYGLDILLKRKCEIVLTPHVGEFSKLISISIDKILSRPVKYLKSFVRKYKVIVILKSSSSLIYDGKNTSLNISGNTGLAKAGSGDLLTGIIGGLLSNGVNMYTSTCLGSYILGYAANIETETCLEMSIVYLDIIKGIKKVLNKLFL